MFKPFRCSRCSKGFTTEKGTLEHIKTKHPSGGNVQKTQREQKNEEADESMADRAIQAQLDKAMGVYNFDQEWLI